MDIADDRLQEAEVQAQGVLLNNILSSNLRQNPFTTFRKSLKSILVSIFCIISKSKIRIAFRHYNSVRLKICYFHSSSRTLSSTHQQQRSMAQWKCLMTNTLLCVHAGTLHCSRNPSDAGLRFLPMLIEHILSLKE